MEETNNNVNEVDEAKDSEVAQQQNAESNPEAEEYYAQLQRVMADFDNYRKRNANL